MKLFDNFELEPFPEPDLIRLKYPVLLCHGFGSVTSLLKPTPLFEVCLLMRRHGVVAFAPNIVPYATIETRSEEWIERIRTLTDRYGFEKVNLVAHSMGGLDLRYVISHKEIRERVASLTTVATPHHGTSLAEWILDTPELVLDKLGEFFNWFGNQVYRGHKSNSLEAVRQLTRNNVELKFNPETPDPKGVPLFSWSSAVGKGTDWPIQALLKYQNGIIYENEGMNDGFVSAKSAVWGEHLGTTPLSHLDQLMINTSGERNRMVSEFWLRLLYTLQKQGF